jgi:hypothetical protein
VRNDDSAEIRVVANYVADTGALAQSVSRKLQLHPGLRGLFNLELTDNISSSIIAQLSLNSTNSNIPNVQCGVTRVYDSQVTCDGQVDLISNQFTATLTDTTTSQVFELTADFSDSAAADIVMTSGADSVAGQGVFANTELAATSVLTSSGSQLTAIDIKNTDPLFNRGRLISMSGQNLGMGADTPLILWNNNYVDVYSSYEILPIDDKIPQSTMTNVAYRSAVLLNADTFTVQLSNTSQPEFDENYTVTYQASDPTALFLSGLFPPDRTNFTINGVAIAGTLGSSSDPVVIVEGNPIAIAWADTTNSAILADLRWRLAIRSTTDFQKERRSQWMSSASQELTFADSTIQWTAPPNFTDNLLGNLPGDADIYLRIRDSADTMRGAAQSIFVRILSSDSNAPPIAFDDSVITTQNRPVNISVLANDRDFEGDALSVSKVETPSNGTVSVGTDGVVTYTPATGFTGSDQFQYQITDTKGGTDTALVTVNVIL